MILGGNKSLKQHFAEFDLLDTPLDEKYSTNAAAYYRERLRCLCNDMEFAKVKPEYLEGKAARMVESPDERSQNDADEEVDPVDFMVDSFWSGVSKTG